MSDTWGQFGSNCITRVALTAVLLAAVVLLWTASAGSTDAHAKDPLAPLSTLAVPVPPDIQKYIRDDIAAMKLGKALFWDMQAGSDGRTACATCHYDAGTDNRSRNQLNPRGGGFDFNGKGPNAQMDPGDFPFHRLANPDDAASAVLFDTDNVSGSQGVLPSTFDSIFDGDPFDRQTFAGVDPDFHVGGVNVRRSTGRNTPSAINAVFNFRQFWDGRAQNDFNGVNPFGSRDPGARVGQVNGGSGVDLVPISVTNASLASQAVGPPGNPVEMSADGRSLSDIGRKLLSLRPLGTQAVSASDSVLGSDVHGSGRGLSTSYGDLIRQAFEPTWWDSGQRVTAGNGREYSLMQFNFPLFWGLAIQAYESTLVSDETPVDRFLAGDTGALNTQEESGMGVFEGKGGCANCHGGAAFTSATAAQIAADGPTAVDGGLAHDTGFFNIGVRPTASDPGNGGTDPFGAPLSIARLSGQTPDGVEGTFKTPGLRNVALSGPFFHNGGQMTLRQVVDFYNRGGDFTNAEKSTKISPRGLSEAEKNDLVSFLEALTDPRVRNQSAPFDHPQLFVPLGEQTNGDGSIVTDGNGRAVDCFREIAATGAAGGTQIAPFPTFTGPPCDTPNPLGGPGPSGGGGSAPGPAPAPVGTFRPSSNAPRRRCVVPRLKGRTLAQARRRLARANCRLGAVRGPRRAGRGRRLVIVSQRLAPGSRHRAGRRVIVRVRTTRIRTGRSRTTR